MQFSNEWKRLWPISSVFSPPLLNPNTHQNDHDQTSVGPLLFNPLQETIFQLFSSPDYLSPRFTPPFPNLVLQRFLSTTSSSPVPYSTATSIISNNTLTQSDYDANDRKLNNNLQLLTCPFSSRVYTFVPAGENLEKIGILVVSVNKDSNFEVKHNNGKPFFVENDMHQHRITKLLINPVIDPCDSCEDSEGFVNIAYMVSCCKYSASWYSIKVRRNSDSSGGSCPVVECIGSKGFRSSSVVHVSWSPHLVEESVVTLENGELFLFDLSSYSESKRLAGKKLGIMWDTVGDDGMKLGGGNVWLGCEFSWHPRILVVAHSSRLFLVDMRSRDFKVRSLLNIENVSSMKNDAFVALSMAGTDGFHFVVASKELLLLCDVRIPKMPLLRWVHCLDSPNHINVLKLSELRSNSSEEMYKWASKSGYSILLGSFWDGEFKLFCYGPDYGNATCLSKLHKVNDHFSAWGLPSDIPLSGCGCQCGTCLVREEVSKEALHNWIDWRQKKELVMGFGFVEQEISSRLSGPNNFGGFHLIRLMSSGKLEVQRYSAAWKLDHISEKAHKEPTSDVEDNHFYDISEPTYDLPKRYQFLRLANMKNYMPGNEAPDSYGDVLDGFAVNLGDDTEDFDFKTPMNTERPGVNHSNMKSNLEKSAYVISTNQGSASIVKNEGMGPELFDKGCPYNLKFNDNGIELGQQGLQMCNWLITHRLKFKESFK